MPEESELRRIGKKVERMDQTLYGDGNGSPGLVKRFDIVDKFYSDWQAVEINKVKEAQGRDRDQARRDRIIDRWRKIILALIALIGLWFSWLEIRHKFTISSIPDSKVSQDAVTIQKPSPNGR